MRRMWSAVAHGHTITGVRVGNKADSRLTRYVAANHLSERLVHDYVPGITT